MSRLAEAAATSHALSLAAMEEVSRYGQREADIDHLLLALTVSEQLAGQVLRAEGITLDRARSAVEAQHTAQLASLGVSVNPPVPGDIPAMDSATTSASREPTRTRKYRLP